MNIANAILWKYPSASPLTDFMVRDDGDERGVYLDLWNIDSERPTDVELSVWHVEALKEAKIKECNALCNQTILAGFESAVLGDAHTYQFDYEAQMNLNGQLNLMNVDPSIDTVEWKTVDAGVLSHTKAQFIQLCKDAMAFKQTNIAKYWTLKAQINAATNEETINAVIW